MAEADLTKPLSLSHCDLVYEADPCKFCTRCSCCSSSNQHRDMHPCVLRGDKLANAAHNDCLVALN